MTTQLKVRAANGHAQAKLPEALQISLHPAAPSKATPLEALATLGREIALSTREYQRLNDPEVAPHGTLQVMRQSLLRAVEAANCLIGHEEGPRA